MAWDRAHGLRLWRSPDGDFNGDECLDAVNIYNDDELAAIAREGFNAIWLRGRLYDLIQHAGWPELRRAKVDQRLVSLRTVIERGRRQGISVYLYFNEPLALEVDDPLWRAHPELAGEPYCEKDTKREMVALCVSQPGVRDFFRSATTELFAGLPDLGGVILITASEFHTHCWSHHARRSLNDGTIEPGAEPLACPRCREREPTEIVGELVRRWVDAAQQAPHLPRVLVWNWSWSMWYPDPQTEVTARLPAGVEMLIDFERGGWEHRNGHDLLIDEYALSYVGPSERYTATAEAAQQRELPVHAKLQIGATHELGTVPNLPLIPNLYAKLRRMSEQGVAGTMACWNFGSSRTLNTAALRLYVQAPERHADERRFLKDLARAHFGPVDTDAVVEAWHRFCRAFAHYPFSMKMIYRSPINYAPAYPLLSRYEGTPLGQSWVDLPWGDRLEDCLGPFEAREAADAFARMSEHWAQGLGLYERALTDGDADSENLRRHRDEELSTARAIGLHLRAMAHILRFHDWRQQIIAREGLQPPCALPLDEQGRVIMQDQLAVMREALPLVEHDPRLGFHQDPHVHFYDADILRCSIERMEADLTQHA